MRPVVLLCAVLALASLTSSVASGSALQSDLSVAADSASSSAVQLPGYREPIAQQLRFFSQASYCSVDSVSAWSCPVCAQGSLANFKLTHRFFDANTNTFGFAGLAPAARGENIIVLSLRGATPSRGRNWLTDLTGQRVPYPGLRGASVHKGMYHAYLSVARAVNLALRSLLANCAGCHVYVTGHSLGGALATLAAADLYALTPDLTVYTFGSPRVGDLAFASWFDRVVPDAWRLVHEADVVPHVPQRFLGFRHVGREVWFYPSSSASGSSGGNAGKWKLCGGGEDDSCSNSLLLHVDESSIRDHATYLDHPMGCRPADLSAMGLISLVETEAKITRPNPLQKLKDKYAGESVLLEVEVDHSHSAAADDDQSAGGDSVDALSDEREARLALSGGVDVTPARVLDPLSRPGIREMENVFHNVQSGWSKLPVSWNPKIKEETAEDRWNRKYPEPK